MASQITLEPPTVQPTVLEAMSTSLIGVSADAKPSTNDSFLRHDTYFFKDGNITFLVRVCIVRTRPADNICRSMVHFIVFIVTFSLATRSTSPPSFPSSASVITNL